MWPIVAVPLGLYALHLIRTGAAANALITTIDSVSFDGLDKAKWALKFTLHLTLRNPTSKDINVELIYLSLLLGNKSIGTAGMGVNDMPPEMRPMMNIKGNSANGFKVPISISFAQFGIAVGVSLVDFLTSGMDIKKLLPESIGVDGYVKANGVRANVKKLVPLKKQPETV